MTLGAIHQTQIELVATGMAVGETCGVVARQHAAGEWCKKQLFPVERLLAVGVAGAQCPCWSGGVAHTELVNVDVAPAKAGTITITELAARVEVVAERAHARSGDALDIEGGGQRRSCGPWP